MAARSAMLCLTVLVTVPMILSAELAVFTDGRILHVADAYLDGARIVLTLPGGGSLTVPARRIDRVISDVLSTPEDDSAEQESSCNPNWVDQDLPAGVPYATEITRAAKAENLNPRLLAALVRAESAFDPNAISRAGAQGLTQLMPAAAADHSVENPFDPAQNLAGGAAHLRMLIDRFSTLRLALAAYNAGAATVERHEGIPPYRETRNYVSRVLKRFCGGGEDGRGKTEEEAG